MNVWQIGAGDSGRDFGDLFLRFGMMAVGPGEPGPWPGESGVYDGGPRWLHAFCEQILDGDLVVLRGKGGGGSWPIRAVGRVNGPYGYEPVLSDVEGWDLQHVRRVRWRVPVDDATVAGASYRPTLSRAPQVAEQAERLWAASSDESSRPLPPVARPVELDQLIDLLLNEGLTVSGAETVTKTLARVTRLARWYRSNGEDVGEHEIRTFLVVPLLLALGWPEQCIKVELRHADLALFNRPYGHGDAPAAIVETKTLFHGLPPAASEQAARYAAGYPTCQRVVVTDGLRYRLAERRDETWETMAYANLLDLRDAEPLRGSAGAVELFLALLPGAR